MVLLGLLCQACNNSRPLFCCSTDRCTTHSPSIWRTISPFKELFKVEIKRTISFIKEPLNNLFFCLFFPEFHPLFVGCEASCSPWLISGCCPGPCLFWLPFFPSSNQKLLQKNIVPHTIISSLNILFHSKMHHNTLYFLAKIFKIGYAHVWTPLTRFLL